MPAMHLAADESITLKPCFAISGSRLRLRRRLYRFAPDGRSLG